MAPGQGRGPTHMSVFFCAFRLSSVSICQIAPPISELKENTYICHMLAPWVQCYTSRKSWPQPSILHTHKDDIFAGIHTFVYNSKGLSPFLEFAFPSRARPAQRVTPAVTRLTVYRWSHICFKAFLSLV